MTWLEQQPWNNLLLMVIMVWMQTGFAMVVLSAAIKAIPDEIIEAARIDGASEFQVFRRIMVPSILPTIVVVTTYMVINAMKVFDIVFVMGSPESSGSIPNARANPNTTMNARAEPRRSTTRTSPTGAGTGSRPFFADDGVSAGGVTTTGCGGGAVTGMTRVFGSGSGGASVRTGDIGGDAGGTVCAATGRRRAPSARRPHPVHGKRGAVADLAEGMLRAALRADQDGGHSGLAFRGPLRRTDPYERVERPFGGAGVDRGRGQLDAAAKSAARPATISAAARVEHRDVAVRALLAGEHRVQQTSAFVAASPPTSCVGSARAIPKSSGSSEYEWSRPSISSCTVLVVVVVSSSSPSSPKNTIARSVPSAAQRAEHARRPSSRRTRRRLGGARAPGWRAARGS